MKPKELIEKAKKELVELTSFKKPAGVGIKKEKDEWVVTVEVIEKESIPEAMDILGTYDVHFDANGDLRGYERKELRKRGDTGAYGKEE